MRLKVLAFGRLKTPGLRAAADYYLKLSKSFCPVEEIELKPLAVPDKAPATRRQIQEKEAEILQRQLSDKASGRTTLYLLDEGGKTLTTRQWADLVTRAENDGTQNLCFLVGSSLGFSEYLRTAAKGRILSLGSQTLPHELARVVLYEQIYRALSVTRGHPYHNEGSS